MRDLDDAREKAFFSIFQEYFDLERDVGKQHDVANYSLDRMYPLASLAGNPEKSLKILHIAGTKGKGSTSYYLGALLNAAGKHCGIFTSPHLDTVRERFQIDDQLMSYSVLEAGALPLCQHIKAAGLHPSLFEIFTVLALEMFAQGGLEYVVLETGIGGRLDATNYAPAKLAAIITPLSFDHMALLGNTIEAIAGEKAGILRANTPVILAHQPYPAAEKVILDRAAALQAPVLRPDDGFDLSPWLPANTPPYLQDNFRVAMKAIQAIGLQPAPAHFQAPTLRARFEVIRKSPLVIIDAAHNGDSARRLTQATRACCPGVHFVCVVGSVPGKDVKGIVEGLKGMDAEFILTNPDTARGSALPQLQAAAEAAHLPVRAIIEHIASPGDLPAGVPLLFTGSFFTALIGEKLFH